MVYGGGGGKTFARAAGAAALAIDALVPGFLPPSAARHLGGGERSPRSAPQLPTSLRPSLGSAVHSHHPRSTRGLEGVDRGGPGGSKGVGE